MAVSFATLTQRGWNHVGHGAIVTVRLPAEAGIEAGDNVNASVLFAGGGWQSFELGGAEWTVLVRSVIAAPAAVVGQDDLREPC